MTYAPLRRATATDRSHCDDRPDQVKGSYLSIQPAAADFGDRTEEQTGGQELVSDIQPHATGQ
ncbi:hypothetical protein [Mycobacterium uberis]|uniref:hypothetical protein n=1 Tax=Mycobacterium uberis TaxID=2162698 RepID=UPI001FB25F82|nr:hypothetical protein [Mycobacterium uberis]